MPNPNLLGDGTVLVSRDECDRWQNDTELRERVRDVGLAGGHRLFAVCTAGGYVVDVWHVDHWQSGLKEATCSS